MHGRAIKEWKMLQARSKHIRLPDLEQLRRLAEIRYTREDCSPLGPCLCLVLDERLMRQIPEAADAGWLNDALAAFPCPVVGIVPVYDNAFPAVACDAVVASEAELNGVLARIENAPLAAASLVQVLRAVASMRTADALNLESFAYASLQAGPEFRGWLGANAARTGIAAKEEGLPVLIRRTAGGLELRLNRPANRNALSVELRDALCEALQLVLSDPRITSVTIAGEGRCFSVGGDLKEFGTAPDPATGHAIRSIRMPARLLEDCAERVEFRLHGACIGAGVELPAFARTVTATKTAFFQLPEIKFGLIPGAGGCVSITRRIGRQRTAFLGLSGRRISAVTALRWGLVDQLSG
jgi:enoyl-CoA hydratase